MICLVGAGDSTKTSILTAVEWVLSPRWSLPASDADFFGAITAEPVEIDATVGGLPGPLLRDDRFGLALRGWGAEGLHDEPTDSDEPVITIRLTIDDSLEPKWQVVNDRQSEPRQISARDRESLGVGPVGPDVDKHLTWGRGSALLRLTDSTDEMGETLAAAYRSARDQVNAADLTGLNAAAGQASDLAKAFGAGVVSTYRPGLDASALAGASALGLHVGSVPVRSAGLGSRRLTALAIQRASFAHGSVLLIDEVESGLEPHRLRYLLRRLRATETGQVLMTTHSEIAIVELTTAELRVVRSNDGATTVWDVPADLQQVVRSAPEALLARRVIVGEGKTEVGLCRALEASWTSARGAPPAEKGIVLIPGDGASAPRIALGFAGLGYPTALLVDSDVVISPPEEDLTARGVSVHQWAGTVCTEERVLMDLPWAGVLSVITRASELQVTDEPQAVYDSIASQLGAPMGTRVDEWLHNGFDQAAIRRAAGKAAKKQGWFKRIDLGEALGAVIADALPGMVGTDLKGKLDALEAWAYAD